MTRILLYLILTCFFQHNIQAQKNPFNIDVYAGFTANNLTTYQFNDYEHGYIFGADLGYALNDKSSLSLGIALQKRDYSLDFDTNNLSSDLEYRSMQIQIPLDYTYAFDKKWTISLGAYASFSFNQTLRSTLENNNISRFAIIEYPSGIQAIDDLEPIELFHSGATVGLNLGLGYQLGNGYSLGLEFARDLTKFYKPEKSQGSALWYLQNIPNNNFPNDEVFDIDEMLLNSYGTFFTLKFSKRFDF